MPKRHNRKLGLLGTAMTTARMPRFTIEVATAVRDDLEKVMIDCGYLENAPFEWVTVSLRYGLKNDNQPHYDAIDEEYGDLPLSIELDVSDLQNADRKQLQRAFEAATLKALIAAGERFSLPIETLLGKLQNCEQERDDGSAAC